MVEQMAIFTATWVYMQGGARPVHELGERERSRLASQVSEFRRLHPRARIEYLLSSSTLGALHEYDAMKTTATLVAIAAAESE